MAGGHSPVSSTKFKNSAMASHQWSKSHEKAVGGNELQPMLVPCLKVLETRLMSSPAMRRNGSPASSSSPGPKEVPDTSGLFQIAFHNLRSSSTMAWGDAVRSRPSPTVVRRAGAAESRLTTCGLSRLRWGAACRRGCAMTPLVHPSVFSSARPHLPPLSLQFVAITRFVQLGFALPPLRTISSTLHECSSQSLPIRTWSQSSTLWPSTEFWCLGYCNSV